MFLEHHITIVTPPHYCNTFWGKEYAICFETLRKGAGVHDALYRAGANNHSTGPGNNPN